MAAGRFDVGKVAAVRPSCGIKGLALPFWKMTLFLSIAASSKVDAAWQGLVEAFRRRTRRKMRCSAAQ